MRYVTVCAAALAFTLGAEDAVAKLNGAMNAALRQEDVRARLGGAGIEIQGGTPAEFAAVIQAEIDKWGRIVKEAGIQPE